MSKYTKEVCLALATAHRESAEGQFAAAANYAHDSYKYVDGEHGRIARGWAAIRRVQAQCDLNAAKLYERLVNGETFE